jgi:adenine C2-methylase RlmN of 23S rRNA A2503 and tRNA A37
MRLIIEKVCTTAGLLFVIEDHKSHYNLNRMTKKQMLGWITADGEEDQDEFTTLTAIQRGSLDFLSVMSEVDHLTVRFLRTLSLTLLSEAEFLSFHPQQSLIWQT